MFQGQPLTLTLAPIGAREQTPDSASPDVPVGPHTADAFALPDRNALVTSRVELGTPNGSVVRLVEVPSGHDLDQWPGFVYIVEVQPRSR
jgi:hypothetical protein